MAEELSCLVVGCGAIGSGYDEQRGDGSPLTHAGAYHAHPDTVLAGGVDLDPDSCARFEQRWNVPCSNDLEAALAGKPAIVSVCTPAEGRRAVVEQIVEARPTAIWCEKPMAETSEEADEIRSLCEDAGVALQLNFHRRFDPLHKRIAALVHSDPPSHLDVRFSGTLRNYGAHAADLFRWFVGEPEWVAACALPNGELAVVLGTRDGTTGSFIRVQAGSLDLFECDVFTPKHRVSLTSLGESALVGAARPSDLWSATTVLGAPELDPETGLAGTMQGGVQSLVDHIVRGQPLECDGRDGVASLRIVEAAERAARSSEVVALR